MKLYLHKVNAGIEYDNKLEGYNIYHTPQFVNTCHRLGLDEGSIVKLESLLLSNPEAGDMIETAGGARKLRIDIDGHGKSGGYRLIYALFREQGKIWLLLIYPKSKKASLSQREKNALKKLLDKLKKVNI